MRHPSHTSKLYSLYAKKLIAPCQKTRKWPILQKELQRTCIRSGWFRNMSLSILSLNVAVKFLDEDVSPKQDSRGYLCFYSVGGNRRGWHRIPDLHHFQLGASKGHCVQRTSCLLSIVIDNQTLHAYRNTLVKKLHVVRRLSLEKTSSVKYNLRNPDFILSL